MPELGLGFQAMDSPETSKLATGSDSPPVQDSPFFNYISNLSPISCVRSTQVTRELSRLNSPPIVFKTPQRKLQNGTNILKRSHSLQLLYSPQASRSISRGRECVDGPVDAEISITRNGLIAETHKGCEVAGSPQTHQSSSSGCVDEFLADPGEGYCVSSATPTLKQSNDATASYQTGLKDSKENVLNFDPENDALINGERNVEELLVSLEDSEKGVQGGSESGFKSIVIEEEQRDAVWPSYRCPDIKASSHVALAFKKQSCQNFQAQVIEPEHHDDLECASQPSPELFPVQTNKDHSDDVGGVSNRLVRNIMDHVHEASENIRGVRRRCLHFEEAPPSTVRFNGSSSNLTNTISSSKRFTALTGLKTLKPSDAGTKELSERPMVDLPQSTPTLSHARSSENLSMPSKPFGIGLHLNKIVTAASLGCAAAAGKQSTDHYMGIEGMKSGVLEKTHSCSTSLSVTATKEERVCSAKSLAVASSVTEQFPHKLEDPYPTEDKNENFNPQDAEGFHENDQSSPRKKRKKAASSLGGDGCKRCNCKKTKCLKLYCDCFAAGVYCSGPCSCQGCFNKPEHKDKVLETREQIESRNPLAFAPKIVQRISDLPPNNGENGNHATPSSARHKRGCNCKRSMCLKKYCECYQANVGCSSGCRCEGCENVYGKKEEYVALEHGATREIMDNIACKERLESTFDNELEMVEIKGDILCSELIIPNNLTPLTPSLQHSDHGKNAPKSRFLSKRYLPSPDPDPSILSSNEKPTKSPLRDSANNGNLFETREALQIEGSSDWQAENNMGKSDSILSRPTVVPNAHRSTKHSDPPIPMISSTSLRRDCINVSRSDCLLSRSLTRQGSPLTPKTSMGRNKPSQVPDSGCELVDIFESNETPVKVSSPNKKRVCPPNSHMYKLGSGSSGALRSGRKIILRSVPSFPSLSPCINSKGNSISESTDKLQANSSIKK